MRTGIAVRAAFMMAVAVPVPAVMAADTAPGFRPKVDDAIVFPDIKYAMPKGGIRVDRQTIANLVPGMTKAQVRQLLGSPHFFRGLFGVRRWDYVVWLRGSGGAACRYQIAFDARFRVEDVFASTKECADGSRDAPAGAEAARAVDGAARRALAGASSGAALGGAGVGGAGGLISGLRQRSPETPGGER